MRLFFAVWPPPATAHALGKWAREVQAAAGSRATPEAAIHLTLAFLGEADPGRAASAARHVAGRAHALPVEQAQDWKHRRIVRGRPGGMAGGPALAAPQAEARAAAPGGRLVEARERALEPLGLARGNSRPAVAHLDDRVRAVAPGLDLHRLRAAPHAAC